MTQLSLIPTHWLHLKCDCCRHQVNVPVATFPIHYKVTIFLRQEQIRVVQYALADRGNLLMLKKPVERIDTTN